MGQSRTERITQPVDPLNASARLAQRTSEAFAEAERQGLLLAAKVRTIALSLVMLKVAIDDPNQGLTYLYNLSQVFVFIVIGGLQIICIKKRILVNVIDYAFVLVDCILLAIIFTYVNPFIDKALPPSVILDGTTFMYFLLFLMQAAFSYRPNLVVWCGFCIAGAWTGMWLWFAQKPGVFTNLDLAESSTPALVAARADPNFLFLGYWATAVLVVLLLAAGLSVMVRRSRKLVEEQIAVERTRASLSRYFSPNVVDRLSRSDDPLHTATEQHVAVLFTDIMDFTNLCESASAADVIALLRDYHDRLGQTVFDNGGTLDKYIGDGLMATFGTPEPGEHDALRALQCAIDMVAALEAWNAERAAKGAAPVRVGIGLHYGKVIVGDIGNERRLEYSVIGDTVNIASRLETLTRELDTPLVVSDDLVEAINADAGPGVQLVQRLAKAGLRRIKGREASVAVWTLDAQQDSAATSLP